MKFFFAFGVVDDDCVNHFNDLWKLQIERARRKSRSVVATAERKKQMIAERDAFIMSQTTRRNAKGGTEAKGGKSRGEGAKQAKGFVAYVQDHAYWWCPALNQWLTMETFDEKIAELDVALETEQEEKKAGSALNQAFQKIAEAKGLKMMSPPQATRRH